MNVKFTENGRTLTVALLCEIDHHSAKPIREEIDKKMFQHRPDTLILDFSEVRFMDSSGIGLIIGRSELAGELSASVRIVGLSSALLRLVRLSGIEKIRNISIM